jgi:isopenicillin-N epimerase
MRANGDGADLNRRRLLALSLAAAPAAAAAQTPPTGAPPTYAKPPPGQPPMSAPIARAAPDWNRLRSQWDLDWSEVDLSAMLIASNPRPVREAITRHRQALDRNPITYLERNNKSLQNASRRAAGAYFGAPMEQVALCESTTAGIGLVYAGLNLRYGEEALTSIHDYYVTHEALRLASRRTGAGVRKMVLHEGAASASAPDIVRRVTAAITPATRVLALTWVHSSTGLKLPIRAIADALKPINAQRPPEQRVLFFVDGVHGFGVENTTFAELGCDVLVSGCHKWVFGPRGTGVIFFTPQALARLSPTIPTFLASGAYSAWIGGYDPGPVTAAHMTPGGFKAFEHVWSMSEAFQFLQMVGKEHVAARTYELADRLKRGLAAMPHVRVQTPQGSQMSAGIVSFDVAGLSAESAVSRLRTWRILGSDAPYATPHVRLTPSIRNTPQDIDFALQAVAALGQARG